jgi:hypothetical protein
MDFKNCAGVDESPPFCIHVLSTSIIALLLRKCMIQTDLTDFSCVMSKSLINEKLVYVESLEEAISFKVFWKSLGQKVDQIVDLSSFVCIRCLIHQTWKLLECGFILFWG